MGLTVLVHAYIDALQMQLAVTIDIRPNRIYAVTCNPGLVV